MIINQAKNERLCKTFDGETKWIDSLIKDDDL